MSVVWVLHITSWAGTTPGALHFYGRIQCQEHDRDDVELERTLDAAGARALQRQERESARYQLSDMSRKRAEMATWHAGDITVRFTDRNSLIEAASLAFRAIAEPGDELYEHMDWLRGKEPLAVHPAPSTAPDSLKVTTPEAVDHA